MNLKAMIERLIDLRENQDIQLTLVAVCPNSDAVLEAAVQATSRNNAPMLFAATLNQVDRDGGYTGWTPAAFVEMMNGYAIKYGVSSNLLYPCLDHGGQWLKDVHTRDKLTFEETTAEVRASITAMLEAGYGLLHIDPTVDRTIDEPLPVSLVVERSLDLIEHAEAERVRLGLPPVSYEVGTEEVHGGLVDLSNFETFLRDLYAGLEARNLAHAAPAFVVAQVGTDLHTTRFDKQAAEQLYKIVSPYKALVKGHYSDWVDNPGDYRLAGMGGANVGPEFTAVEYEALEALAQREAALMVSDPQVKASGFFESLAAAVDNSNRWQKWLQTDEQDLPLAGLSPERHAWMLKTCSRYIWTDPEVVAARERLYRNISPILPNPNQFVVDRITEAIEQYMVAFQLFNSMTYFAD
jgi:D-tagatose-1,6-bisphosphate aldolase subunit GatZ/KbaZ